LGGHLAHGKPKLRRRKTHSTAQRERAVGLTAAEDRNAIVKMAIPEQSPSESDTHKSPSESDTHRPLDPNAGTAAVPEREPSSLQAGSQEPDGEPTLASSSSSHDLRASSSDYGFAGSWPSIPVPLTPSGALATNLLVSQNLQHQDSHLQGGAGATSSSSSSSCATAAAAAAAAAAAGAEG
ncbi:unnamed protein product, partial [Laminaria digitata]